MNILLVDDDVNVLESLQFGVAYSSLGIEKIYVAENAADAKKILKNVPIHIMVTDIEMPNESGSLIVIQDSIPAILDKCKS